MYWKENNLKDNIFEKTEDVTSFPCNSYDEKKPEDYNNMIDLIHLHQPAILH